MIRIGVDLGGTKIEAIALAADGTVLARERTATPAGDYDGTLRAIRDLVAGIEHRLASVATVGVGAPGSISRASGLMRNANSIVLNGKPLDADLERVLARPVRIANDADCFTLSEAVDGAGAGAHCVFGVILGTGVGGGIAIDGRLHAGRHGIAGEWGHTALPRVDAADLPLRICWCGQAGCVERYLSGPALALDHADPRMTAEAIALASQAGDADARATLRRYTRRLARSLATVIDVLDPDTVVLGGGLSGIDSLYDDLPALLRDVVFCDEVTTTVVKNRHGDSSGVRGAACCGRRDANRQFAGAIATS